MIQISLSFYGDLLFKVYSGFPLKIIPFLNHGSFNMETKSNNILINKKYFKYRLLCENKKQFY